MRRKNIILWIGVSISIILVTLFSCGFTEELDTFMADPGIVTPDLSRVADGIYEGEYEVGPIQVVVDVEMRSGVIARCTIVKHRTGKGKPAEVIVGDIVKAQSLDVDAVSGATYSSEVIKKAVQVALEKGLQ